MKEKIKELELKNRELDEKLLQLEKELQQEKYEAREVLLLKGSTAIIQFMLSFYLSGLGFISAFGGDKVEIKSFLVREEFMLF